MKILTCLAVLAALAIAGCGDQGPTEQTSGKAPSQSQPAAAAQEQDLQVFEMTINGYPNANYGGLLLGDQLGYFEDAGLQLQAHTPIEPSRPIRYVAEEVVDFGISHQPEVTLARARGAPIVAVASWLPRPTTSLIWLKRSHIHGIADLRGKTIATEGLEYQEKLLQAILARAGLGLDDVKVIRPGYSMIPALEEGRADATIGGSWNVDGIVLRQEGFDPVVVPVSKLGVPGYEELVVIAREDHLADDESLIRKFLTALSRGNEAAIAHPAAAAKALKDIYPEINEKAAAMGVAVTAPMLSRSHRMDGARWRSFQSWMEGNELLKEEPPASAPYTNAYVP